VGRGRKNRKTEKKLHDEELNLCTSPNFIRVIKLRMRWTVFVVGMVAMRDSKTVLIGNTE
jgi:hypothetical protein